MIEVPDSAPFALSGGCSSEPHLRSTPQGTQQGAPLDLRYLHPIKHNCHACQGPATGGKDLLLLIVALFGKREVVPVVAGFRSACRNLELRPDSRPFANDLGLWTLGRLPLLTTSGDSNSYEISN